MWFLSRRKLVIVRGLIGSISYKKLSMPKLFPAFFMGLMALSMSSQAEVTSSLGFATKYIDRGIKQSDQDFVINGGVDYQGPWGVYAGAWAYTGSIEDGKTSEVNAYAGVAYTLGPVAVGVGAITYERGDDELVDNSEYNLNLAWNAYRLSTYQDEDATYEYHELAASYALWGDGGLSFTAGMLQSENLDEVYDFSIRYVQAMPSNVDFDVRLTHHEDRGNAVVLGMTQQFDW